MCGLILYLAWYTTNYVLFLCQQNWIRNSVWSQYPVSHHTTIVPVHILTWGMCVPFKVRIKQLQCLRCEWRPAFSLLGWLNTNKLSEVILPTLISATWPLVVLSDATNKITIKPRECIHWVMDDKSTIYGELAQICWIRVHGKEEDKLMMSRKSWHTPSPGVMNAEGGFTVRVEDGSPPPFYISTNTVSMTQGYFHTNHSKQMEKLI